jgi:methionyl-tRNA synthetase
MLYLTRKTVMNDETIITCPQCGTENTPGADECTNCGMSLEPAEEGIDPHGNQLDTGNDG